MLGCGGSHAWVHSWCQDGGQLCRTCSQSLSPPLPGPVLAASTTVHPRCGCPWPLPRPRRSSPRAQASAVSTSKQPGGAGCMGGPPELLGHSQERGVCLSQGKMVWTGTGTEENRDWGVGIQQGPARGCRASFRDIQLCSSSFLLLFSAHACPLLCPLFLSFLLQAAPNGSCLVSAWALHACAPSWHDAPAGAGTALHPPCCPLHPSRCPIPQLSPLSPACGTPACSPHFQHPPQGDGAL